MNKEERITYEEFMVMFRNAPKFAYMLYDKAEDEIERLNNIIDELTDLILIKKARAENEKDYSKYYIEGFSKALSTTHSTPDGIMLETIKSTTIKLCSGFLDKLKELKGESDEKDI